jgi:hypothetical protein
MSLNSLVLLAALTSCNAAWSATAKVSCPLTTTANGKPAPLDGISVFEGPPEKLVDLMPDLDTSEWDISMNQKYAARRGESMYLVCRYADVAATVTLKIPEGATFCKAEGTKNGTQAWCRPPVSKTKKN